MRSFHFTRKCRFLQSFRADFFCARSCAALASIWAPSSGGIGRRLNAPVSRFAAQKALPRTVTCRDSSTAHTPASAKFTAGPAAASRNRCAGDSSALPSRMQKPVNVTSMTGKRRCCAQYTRICPHSWRKAASRPVRRKPLASNSSSPYSTPHSSTGSRKRNGPIRSGVRLCIRQSQQGRRVAGGPLSAQLKVQVCPGGTAGLPCRAQYLPGLYRFTGTHIQVLQVRIKGLGAVRVQQLQADAIAVAASGSRGNSFPDSQHRRAFRTGKVHSLVEALFPGKGVTCRVTCY